MKDMKVHSIQFEGYKSFPKGVSNEIEMNPYVSVLIGKNNCGKSSCIDAIECVFEPGYYLSANRMFERVSPVFILDSDTIHYGFSSNQGGGDVPNTFNSSHYSYGVKFVGKKIITDLAMTTSIREKRAELLLSKIQPDLRLPEAKREWEMLPKKYANYQAGYEFRRINADRDIIPESESTDETVEFNGNGATNLLRKFINHSSYDEKLVEDTLLNELNSIMAPESHFQSIRVQQIETGNETKWEIYLEEDNGDRFALSKSGSGLKTIILMLINLYIIPETRKYKDKELIFAFEELENNLHPALQRKVFEYIYDFAARKNIHIFITTHSHIAINTYYEKDNASLYHVQKTNGTSSIATIKDRSSRLDVLCDLDVRASDLFQSNGIIWVEGPSDRIYINRWLEVFCNSRFIEGSHYQFLYYGGKTLSHFTADEKLDDFISILKTNQHAAIVIDSDKRNPTAKINQTKARIRKEFEAIDGFCWITKGKEVENYIPASAIQDKYGVTLPDLGPYDIFPDYISAQCKNFSTQKVPFAKNLVGYINANNSENILDLRKQVEKLYQVICRWNQ